MHSVYKHVIIFRYKTLQITVDSLCDRNNNDVSYFFKFIKRVITVLNPISQLFNNYFSFPFLNSIALASLTHNKYFSAVNYWILNYYYLVLNKRTNDIISPIYNVFCCNGEQQQQKDPIITFIAPMYPLQQPYI